MTTARTNTGWVESLSSAGPERDHALLDLRATLVKGLRYSLNRYGTAEELAEDFAQEALIRISERIESYRGDSPVSPHGRCRSLRESLSRNFAGRAGATFRSTK